MNYSVIIPSYNSQATIVRCLQAITRQCFVEPYEVIVVDSSTDATPEIIRQHFPRVTCLHFPTKTEAGAARNIGAQHAQGAILCFLDADCLASDDWLRKMVDAHQGRYAAVGGAILNGNPEQIVGWAGYFAEFREFFPYHRKRVVRHVASCNMAYKREVFDRYGGFPAEYYPQEDLVLNLQLDPTRELILFDPDIKVAHLNKTALKHFLIHQYRIGRVTAEVLKQFPVLKGGIIARSRLLTLLTIPFLPFVKFINTFRVAAQSGTYRKYFLWVSPLLLGGLFVWGSGFLKGAWFPSQMLNYLTPCPLSKGEGNSSPLRGGSGGGVSGGI